MLWTVASHQKAEKAHKNPYFLEAVVKPIPLLEKVAKIFDQPIKQKMTLDLLKSIQTVNLIDLTNTAHLHDGAALVLMGNQDLCEKVGIQPKFKIVASAVAGGAPDLSPLGVIWATEKLLKQQNMSVKDIDLFEINESFSVKPVAFFMHFGVKVDKMNIFGGTLAFGHPFGASGTINLIHLMQAMTFKKVRFGLVAIGVAGGLGAAVLIENLMDTSK